MEMEITHVGIPTSNKLFHRATSWPSPSSHPSHAALRPLSTASWLPTWPYPCISTGLLIGVSTSWAASPPGSSVWLSVRGSEAYGRTLASLPSSGVPSISTPVGVWRPLPIPGPAAATRDRRRLRRKRPAPASPLLDGDEAMKMVAVGAGEVDVCVAEDEDEV
jgi:hypothetical protein